MATIVRTTSSWNPFSLLYFVSNFTRFPKGQQIQRWLLHYHSTWVYAIPPSDELYLHSTNKGSMGSMQMFKHLLTVKQRVIVQNIIVSSIPGNEYLLSTEGADRLVLSRGLWVVLWCKYQYLFMRTSTKAWNRRQLDILLTWMYQTDV